MSIESTPQVSEYSFEKGWKHLSTLNQPRVKEEIMSLTGITTDSNFYRRLRGEVEPRWSEKEGIEEIFKKYGVAKKNIWGAQ